MDEREAKVMREPTHRNPQRRDVITAERRRELNRLALFLADKVQAATRPHERCLLRRMVELFLGEEE